MCTREVRPGKDCFSWGWCSTSARPLWMQPNLQPPGLADNRPPILQHTGLPVTHMNLIPAPALPHIAGWPLRSPSTSLHTCCVILHAPLPLLPPSLLPLHPPVISASCALSCSTSRCMRMPARPSFACTAASTRYTTLRTAAGGGGSAGNWPGPWTVPARSVIWGCLLLVPSSSEKGGHAIINQVVRYALSVKVAMAGGHKKGAGKGTGAEQQRAPCGLHPCNTLGTREAPMSWMSGHLSARQQQRTQRSALWMCMHALTCMH